MNWVAAARALAARDKPALCLRGWQWGAPLLIAALALADHPPCWIGVAMLIASAWITGRMAHDRETARIVQRNMREYIQAGGLDR